MSRQVVVHPTAEASCRAAADRFIERVRAVQSGGRDAHVCLTGGRGGHGVLSAIGEHSRRDDVDWSRVHFWWSDERFLPSGDPERNETGSREALLDHVPLDDSKVHPMPASGESNDLDGAAMAYAQELRDAGMPVFDISMLGMGEDGHCASLFPHHPALDSDAVTIAITDSPKPPPERITFGYPTINNAREVWVIAFGVGKATAVKSYLEGAPVEDIPSAGAQGQDLTLLWLDSESSGG